MLNFHFTFVHLLRRLVLIEIKISAVLLSEGGLISPVVEIAEPRWRNSRIPLESLVIINHVLRNYQIHSYVIAVALPDSSRNYLD